MNPTCIDEQTDDLRHWVMQDIYHSKARLGPIHDSLVAHFQEWVLFLGIPWWSFLWPGGFAGVESELWATAPLLQWALEWAGTYSSSQLIEFISWKILSSAKISELTWEWASSLLKKRKIPHSVFSLHCFSMSHMYQQKWKVQELAILWKGESQGRGKKAKWSLTVTVLDEQSSSSPARERVTTMLSLLTAMQRGQKQFENTIIVPEKQLPALQPATEGTRSGCWKWHITLAWIHSAASWEAGPQGSTTDRSQVSEN